MIAAALICLVLVPSAAPRPARRPAAAPTAPAPTAPKPENTTPSQEVLRQAQAAYAALDYDQVLPLTEVALGRSDLTLEERLEAYRLQGSARAIVMDPMEAESAFRLLLRARADYELPAGTPPKILSVFRKVQIEERALAQTLQQVERARMIASLTLLGDPASPATGGKPLRFSFRVKDPTGVVDSVRVPFRREGDKAWSSLALQRNEVGSWEGALAGEVTASEKGFTFEYYVETADTQGVLLTRGTSLVPQRLPVTPGFVQVATLKPIHRAVFFVSAAFTAALGLAAGGLALAFQAKQAEYQGATPPGGTVDGALVQRLRGEGNTLATATNATLIAGGVALVITAVEAPFTAFSE